MRVLSRHVIVSAFSLLASLVYARPVALISNVVHDPAPLLLQSTGTAIGRPSLFGPGSTYRTELSVPVLGTQSFVLKILDDSNARIWIHGVLKLDDSISYAVDEVTGKISFVLTEKTKRVLRRFGTRLGSVGYDAERDEARLEVKPPLPVSITLLFKRVITPS
mmetsp:Transcript_17445/g.33105  ORF Transcript_17445/g.33105 Transcript_17445/m.33105 type:complete len:163 (+) Transcript_17445:234-722(+)|eukprot:scaffold7395_cov175-Amphora_coffeaeformis.AAC.6